MATPAVGRAHKPQEFQHQINPTESGRYSLNLPAIARNLNAIAVPAIVLFALSNLTGAAAGPLEYAGCTAGCALFFTPAAVPGCLTACLPLLFLPGP